jgi:hypothetical protein
MAMMPSKIGLSVCLKVFKRIDTNWLIVVEEAACGFLTLPLCVIARVRGIFSFMVVEMQE